MLHDGWREFSSQILNEVEKKGKLDRVQKPLFLTMLSQNTEKLMQEKGDLHYEKISHAYGESLIPSAKCSRADFLKRLKTSNPKEFKKLIEKSLDAEWYSHREHSYLQKITREKLEQKGYEVYNIDKKEERDKAIKKLRGFNQGYLSGVCQGTDRDPDLIAFKEREILIVEVASRKNRLVRQLSYDQMAGKTLLVLPISIEDVELWGVSQLHDG